MRLLATCLAAALGAALYSLALPAGAAEPPDLAADAAAAVPGVGPPPAARQVPGGPPAQAGNDAEEAAYAGREAASPEVREFSGGVVVVYVSFVGILIVVLLLVLIFRVADDGHV